MSGKVIISLNPDFELKRLGTVMGQPIYVDMAGYRDEESKFITYMRIQKIMADFFNPPKDDSDQPNQDSKEE